MSPGNAHSPESLVRFEKSANYLSRTRVADPNLRQDAAQEALIRAWQAPEGKPLAYYETAMRNRLNDVFRGASFGSNRANHGGRGTRWVDSVEVTSDGDMPDHATTTDVYTSDLDWARRAAKTPLDIALIDGVSSGLQIAEVAKLRGLNPRNVQRHWQRVTKPSLRTAWRGVNR